MAGWEATELGFTNGWPAVALVGDWLGHVLTEMSWITCGMYKSFGWIHKPGRELCGVVCSGLPGDWWINL